MRELTTTVDIDAAPEAVWAVLTDFEHYPEWNPFMRVTGRANEGARLVVDLTPPGGRDFQFRPTVTRVDRDHEFRWLGHLFVPGLYDGEHRFILETHDEGTRLTHAESFGGVLAGLINRFVGEGTEQGFEEMNAALKERVESLATAEANGVEASRAAKDDSTGDEVAV
ncbi:hypothetical protein SAMN04487949_0307 [Halogranum gelatinilyticum]|uniref:Polyketide cyclase / dehydrase and lipid transport n=1 Tax=Halogranum gelatinilyticum TaxID=660521 RepID=A0A1G9PCD9_9EURY|nr:SRPBCC domain-containing protein [Halogranum gelatinilyticum]SDL95815.1 hypothetical protein SAMN04487949_0307 [Halogranum gelatinilyticum]